MRSIVAALLVLLVSAPAYAGHDGERYWPPCPSEDRKDVMQKCVWDAVHQGDGEGRSFFVNLHGVHYVSHARAHRMQDPDRLG